MIWVTNTPNGARAELDYPGCKIGRPKASKERTEEQLQADGYVGVYVTEEYAAQCVINQMMIRKFYVS
jgi:hypothetical protein